jgi:NADH:ubiquinone oxidoreductase subunit F (NADH-binding)/Pyruvate/2-oxoacid:ferredoxin oxidoreductase delta subunit/(2Fe-2S) ferredoxin
MTATSTADWDRLSNDGWRSLAPGIPLVVVGMASCGRAAGAEAVYQRALQASRQRDRHCAVISTGCLGFCQMEPLVEIRLPNGHSSLYGLVTPDRMTELIAACGSQILPEEGCIGRFPTLSPGNSATDDLLTAMPDHPFYRGQVKLVTRRCGRIDPASLDQALAVGAYRGLAQALSGMRPEDVIQLVRDSGLRGRGGAGFPTGLKWQTARDAAGCPKYLICNADEGDPGAYMDRGLLEGDPHAVLEGMLIGGYAIGANRGIVFVRSEYPLAMATMQQAIDDACQRGFLGVDLLGSEFSFEIDLVAGSGAFVSGEETALIAAIEGKIAEPRPRPPFPADQGLYGKPTVINNVETWATIPILLEWGASRFAQLGTSKSKGTKVFSLVGAVARTGLVEVPLGTTLRSLVEDLGGGARPGRSLKALQTGGPSGGCLPAELLDLAVDYETLATHGSIMGSGGLVVMDDATCMVDIARYFLEFTSTESCGKCTPCREGLTYMHRILERICGGFGTNSEVEHLLELAELIQRASLCGLGKSAPNPVLTTFQYFREELLAHVFERRCPAGVCRALIRHVINSEDCTGCGACVGVCPTQAIHGRQDIPHQLDGTVCIQCGACKAVCRVGAIQVRDRYPEPALSSL